MTSRASFDAAQAGRADTIVSRFLDHAARDPERNVYTVFPLGALNALGALTWGDWATHARAVAGSLLALHQEKGARLAIYASNRELWPIATLGAAMTGMITVSLSPDETRSALVAQLRDCNPAVVIVDTVARLKVLRSLQAELQQPFAIVCDDLEPLRSSSAESLYEWESWLKAGSTALQQYEPLRAELTRRIETLLPQDVVSIVYKSETPVGVMYSHETVVATAAFLTRGLDITHTDRILVAQSFNQPLECAMGVFSTIYSGASCALVEHSSDALHAARCHQSTIVCGSAEILDGVIHHLRRARMTHADARETVGQVIGAQCRTLIFASEGIATDVERDLQAAGVALMTVYGTPEQPCICQNGPLHWVNESIGRPIAGVELRLDAFNELQVRHGALTSTGYHRRDGEFFQQFVDEGQWLRTCHHAEWLADEALRLSGHAREYIKLAGGATTKPLDIEEALCELPHVAHAVCHALPNQSLVAVLSLRRKEVEAWARKQGVVAPWEALVGHPLVYDELARGIAGINGVREGHERVVAFAPTELEFSVHTGELDATGQLDRAVVLARFEYVFADLHNRPHH